MSIIKKRFKVLDLSCASCAARAEKIIRNQKGVSAASVNFANSEAVVEFDTSAISADQIRDAVRNGGFDLAAEEDEEDDLGAEQSPRFKILKRRTLSAALLTIPIVILGMFLMDEEYVNIVMWILSTIVLFRFGREFYINAWKQARHGGVNMDTLVALSTSIAYLFSVFNTLFPEFWISRGLHPHVYFEAASVIIVFIMVGRLLEERAKGNTTTALKKLMGLQPKIVTVVRDGGYFDMPIEEIAIGDTLLVRPGEKIAVDGTVTDGSSYVDESMLSGEPMAVAKNENDKVFAGTINQKGSFRFRAEKIGRETMLAHIIEMVREAQGSKAPVQKLVDRIASVFVPVVMGIAVIACIIWIIFEGNEGLSHGILALVTVLIIACPCALGLATPTAIMVGIGKGAEKGILIKDAESLETAKKIDAVVLDKTGTITEGHPTVTDVVWLGGDDSAKNVLYSLESCSEHPLAGAITAHFEGAGLMPISEFENITGKGIKGISTSTGKVYFVGNRRLLKEYGITTDPDLEAAASSLKGVQWFADSEKALAAVAVNDKIKTSSKVAIAELRDAGIAVFMLTGDSRVTAEAIAAEAGIANIEAEVLPDKKAEFIKSLQSTVAAVAMVGDGINDSAALAQADISIAMGRGSDIAMDVAKMTIISSDLTKIPEAIRLSKQTVRTIRQNLFWAFIYNVIAIPIAAGALYPINGFLLDPMIAGAAMALSSVSVVTNSLLLKLKK